MGLFSKKTISVSKLAYLLGELAWENHRSPFTERWGKPTHEQKKDVLILSMLAVTQAIQAAFKERFGAEETLNAFHLDIYGRISKFEYERTEFEKLLQNRYRAYYEFLNSDNEAWLLKLGDKFSSFYGKKNPEISLGTGSVFFSWMVTYKQFLDEILSKNELVKED